MDLVDRINIDHASYDESHAYRLAFILQAEKDGKTVYSITDHGKATVSDVTKAFLKLEGRLLHQRDLLNSTIPGPHESMVSWKNGIAVIERKSFENVRVSVETTSKKLKQAAVRCLNKVIDRSAKNAKGSIQILVNGSAGLELSTMGVVNSPLVSNNYSKQVAEKIQHAIACLSSSDPCGRLVVMDGLPGTGKSYAIRAMATEVNASFVFVSPKLVGNITGPDIINVLVEQRDESKKSIVLVMEDADSALTTRKGSMGDNSQLSELLNIGDGLIGELADFRIVATTNAGRVDLDDAVLRAGRMCSHIEFGPLDASHASKIYKKLTGKGVKMGPCTLAEVYRTARQDGWETNAPKKALGTYL